MEITKRVFLSTSDEIRAYREKLESKSKEELIKIIMHECETETIAASSQYIKDMSDDELTDALKKKFDEPYIEFSLNANDHHANLAYTVAMHMDETLDDPFTAHVNDMIVRYSRLPD